jgi:hypothetical protein
MNHVSKSFTLGDGRACKTHSWELREGGYRKTALLLGHGLWPVARETRTISFLLDRGFRVISIDLAFGSASAPRMRLRAYREAVAAFARENMDPELPLYVLAQSLSAAAALPIASALPALAAFALLAPVVDLPPPGLKKSCAFMPSAELPIRPDDLCGDGELAAALAAEGLLPGRAALRLRKADLRLAQAGLAAALAEGLAVPAAAFIGDEDPFVTQDGRAALARAGIKLYAYPRVKHEPGRDRSADNYFADLGSFLSEVESTAPGS